MSLQKVWVGSILRAVDGGTEGKQREIHAEEHQTGTTPQRQDPLRRSELRHPVV